MNDNIYFNAKLICNNNIINYRLQQLQIILAFLPYHSYILKIIISIAELLQKSKYICVFRKDFIMGKLFVSMGIIFIQIIILLVIKQWYTFQNFIICECH